jgi:hypothetical protein
MNASISQRAVAASSRPLVQDIPHDAQDRDRLREEWRLAALKWVELDDNAQRLKDGKSIFFDELVATLLEHNKELRQTQAERMANTSDAYKQYLRKMHDARKAAAVQRIESEDADRRYWAHVNHEANERTERRMTR